MWSRRDGHYFLQCMKQYIITSCPYLYYEEALRRAIFISSQNVRLQRQSIIILGLIMRLNGNKKGRAWDLSILIFIEYDGQWDVWCGNREEERDFCLFWDISGLVRL